LLTAPHSAGHGCVGGAGLSDHGLSACIAKLGERGRDRPWSAGGRAPFGGAGLCARTRAGV